MKYVVVSIISLIFIFLLINDIMFNRKRVLGLKIIEILVFLGLIYLLISNCVYYSIEKDRITNNIVSNKYLSSSIDVYDINGNYLGKTSIGSYIYNNFVHPVFNGKQNSVSLKEQFKNNIIVIVITIIYLIYWIVLLLLYEKEDQRFWHIEDEDILLKKYNPLIAGCIAQNRNVTIRDAVGVIVNLINKKAINMRLVNDNLSSKVKYRYMLSQNNFDLRNLDIIEKYVYDWLFEELTDYKRNKDNVDYFFTNNEGIIELDFMLRMKNISENSDTYIKLKEINTYANKQLHSLGANLPAVPVQIKLLNNLLLMFSIFVIFSHITSNGLNIVISNLNMMIYCFVAIFVITIIPLIYALSLICYKFIKIFFRTLEQITEGYTGRVLIGKSFSIIFATILFIIIFLPISKDTYLVFDILLMGCTCLILFTDDYMLKNRPQILNDFYNLKAIEDKLRNYTLMKSENIEYIELWKKYYGYAIAFNIPKFLNSEIDVPYESTTIMTKDVYEGLFYVCKSYLEEFWNQEYSNESLLIKQMKELF